MEQKLRVGILGATGMVGQRFISLLENHPWFEVVTLAASPRSAGKTYEEAVGGRWKMDTPMPEAVKKLVVMNVNDVEHVASTVDFVFSAVDMSKDEIKAIEEAYAKTETPVVSNNSAHRWTPDVPMVVPEINPEHFDVIEFQKKRLGTKRGFIAVKPNCSIQSYAPVLTAWKEFEPYEVVATTYQAISGAGKTFKDWPEMEPLKENLLLQVASVIRDEVTTTDELIPSGETASYRSNPYKISEFTLIRKDPKYVGRAKAAQEYEKARLAGDSAKAGEFYQVLQAAGVTTSLEELMQTTGIGSVLYAKRPGDGSAREYAASCQKVLGGLADICIEYATKRYRSNCVNWGILPFTCDEAEINLEAGEYVYLPGIREAVEKDAKEFEATVIGTDGSSRKLMLALKDVTEAEKEVLLAGSLINFYKNTK